METSDTRDSGPLSIDDVLDMQPEPEQDTPEQEDDTTDEVEAEVETDAESEAEDEPEAEDEGPQVLTVDEYGDVLVDLNGEQITLSELHKGNLRQADYSRKTQELAQKRKELEAELSQRERAIADRERQLNEQFAQLDAEPDWIKLAEEDPLGYVEQRAKWDAKKAKADASRQKLQAEQQQALREFARKTAEIAVSKVPEWAEGKKFDEGAEARKRAALDAGFTEAEYSQAHDFRLAVLLEKAARYDAMQADGAQKSVAAEKRLAKAPKVLRPGQSSSKADKVQAERAAKEKRLRGPVTMADYLKVKGY